MLVFCGPSLSSKDKEKLRLEYPQISWRPPIKRGDIELALSENNTEILIIDGYFENKNPIWQREIYNALREDVIIYGSASMGALRAAELYEYGMIGIGRIYEMYRSSELDGDDEVALCHSTEPINGEYIETTIPLINLRYALNNATESDEIRILKETVQEMKMLPFENRSESLLQKLLEANGMSSQEAIKTINSIKGDGQYNLKKMDAMIAVKSAMQKKSRELLALRGKHRDADENISMLLDGMKYRKLKENKKVIHLKTLIESNAEKLKILYEQVAEEIHTRFYVSMWCQENGIAPDPGYYYKLSTKGRSLKEFQFERGGFTKGEREITLNKKVLTNWAKRIDFNKAMGRQQTEEYKNIEYILSEISQKYLGKSCKKTIDVLKKVPPSKFGFNYDERLELISYWDIEKLILEEGK